jgi:tRNA pseudouridine32 synthase/23S rRNA pseudouridine746 synthase
MRLHYFTSDISRIALPEAFTFPFRYSPHPLCRLAADEVSRYLSARPDLAEELAAGKMLGVMVVETPEGDVGFLAAFSGSLGGTNDLPYFVTPVADTLAPDGFFRTEEANISAINRRIAELEGADEFTSVTERLKTVRGEAEAALSEAKRQSKEAKRRRDARRAEGTLTPAEEAELTRESQYMKAEERRLKARWGEAVGEAERAVSEAETPIEALRAERKRRSAALQQRLFDAFTFLHARGETARLDTLFAPTGHTPPSGAGECAGPKLLQYAYRHGLKPRCMAEFWWGASPHTEVRRHGEFYPACTGKCAPILAHMLEGLNVEPDPLRGEAHAEAELPILYEDEWLVAVCKPSGLLSVPGRGEAPSAVALLCHRLPDGVTPLSVHRLDMDTSGVLLFAKSIAIQRQMQQLFRTCRVTKRYIAVLDGLVKASSGTITLPLRPDWLDRPRQQVCFEQGKPAHTHYEVIELQPLAGQTRVAFAPSTGRTHQLRVHAAHHLGLGCPIAGDALYGRQGRRLLLHAESIEFVHPVLGRRIRIACDAPF